MKKSKLFAMLTAVALVAAIGVGSTFAYLTAKTDDVVNTFTFDNTIQLDLKESEVELNDAYQYVDADGADTWTVTKNDYKDVVPGQKVFKDPTVTVKANSTACYVFVKVEYNAKQFAEIKIIDDWTAVKDNAGYYYMEVAKDVTNDQTFTVFNEVQVLSTLKETDKLDQITVKAAAIQSRELELADAFAAVQNEYTGF